MEQCYKYFDCEKTECVMFSVQDNKPCWVTIGTLCCWPRLDLPDKSEEKANCNFCLYKINNDRIYQH